MTNSPQFITGNVNKFNEAKQFIPHLEQLNIDLDEIQSLNPKEVIEHKLNQAKQLGHKNFFVEDISLFIDKYKFPGPLIKWVNETIGHELGELFENEPITIICSIGYCDEQGNIEYFEGVVKGKLTQARGEDFGFNPIVIPEGHNITYAQMPIEMKGKINHRAIALKKLQEFIKQNKE
ncbi:MAG: non-canonical purine NTP pyrophosphatase [Candidatus Nanoarchaeia archaeon]